MITELSPNKKRQYRTEMSTFRFNNMNKALLLDANWQPIKVISWKRAITLLFSGRAELIEEHNDCVVRSPRTEIKLPSILKMRGINRSLRRVNLTKENVFFRDKHTCQYCGKKFSGKDLTLDHVLPVCRGGKNTWVNLVAACLRCNQKKAGRTPEESGFRLLSRPVEPKWSLKFAIRLLDEPELPGTWASYLPKE